MFKPVLCQLFVDSWFNRRGNDPLAGVPESAWPLLQRAEEAVKVERMTRIENPHMQWLSILMNVCQMMPIYLRRTLLSDGSKLCKGCRAGGGLWRMGKSGRRRYFVRSNRFIVHSC